MNIIVCIKQVPETTEVRINSQTNTLMREGVKSIINPFDMYAIEEGLRLKERFGGKVTILTMGPPQAESALREAISLGADDAILLSDRAFAGSDTLATSYTLAGAIRKIRDYDLLICGKQASDGDTAQVGPGIAAHLDIPQVTYVKKIEEIKDKAPSGEKVIRVERMTEEGFEIIESPLPALLTVVKEINAPRLPSLKGLIRSKHAKITHWTHKDIEAGFENLGLSGSPTQVVKIFSPPPRESSQMLSGSIEGLVEKLVRIIKKEI